MLHRCRMLMLAPVALALVACGAKTTSLGLRVVDDAGRPVPSARVRVVPLGTSDVPLPVSSQTLGEAFAKTRRTGSTDAAGEVTLTVLAERAHQVQVVPPAIDPTHVPTEIPPALAFFWVISTEPRTLTVWTEPPNPPGLRLELVTTDRRGG